jgi:hypothetical protein
MRLKTDSTLPCIDEFQACLKRQGVSIAGSRLSKSRLQVFLASRSEPGKRLGEAAPAGCWRWDDEAFQPLALFLKSLLD